MVGVGRGHRHEHEAAVSGAQSHSRGFTDAGPPTGARVSVELVSCSGLFCNNTRTPTEQMTVINPLCVLCLCQMGCDEQTEASGSEQQSGVQAAPALLHQPAERRCGEPAGGSALRSPLPTVRRPASER